MTQGERSPLPEAFCCLSPLLPPPLLASFLGLCCLHFVDCFAASKGERNEAEVERSCTPEVRLPFKALQYCSLIHRRSSDSPGFKFHRFGFHRFRIPPNSDSAGFGFHRIRIPPVSDSGEFGFRRFENPPNLDSAGVGLARLGFARLQR